MASGRWPARVAGAVPVDHTPPSVAGPSPLTTLTVWCAVLCVESFVGVDGGMESGVGGWRGGEVYSLAGNVYRSNKG